MSVTLEHSSTSHRTESGAGGSGGTGLPLRPRPGGLIPGRRDNGTVRPIPVSGMASSTSRPAAEAAYRAGVTTQRRPSATNLRPLSCSASIAT
jgi:hypothetical protein